MICPGTPPLFSGAIPIQALEQLIKERGCPIVLRSDRGPEFISIASLQWAADREQRKWLDLDSEISEIIRYTFEFLRDSNTA